MLVINRVRNRFGSLRGLVAHSDALVGLATGRFRRLAALDFQRVDRVVFVCTGNICRSALAEACGNRHGLHCISAGINTRGNDPADSRICAVAQTYGLDMTAHRTRRLTDLGSSESDLFVGMEPSHIRQLLSWNCAGQLTLLGLWHSPIRPYLHDPYVASDHYVDFCVNYICDAVTQIAKRVPSCAPPPK